MKLTIPEQHQLKIAKATLKMNDTFARILGGTEARCIIAKLTEKKNKKNT